MGPDAMILVFWMLSFKPTFSLSSFTFIKRLFSASLLSAIRVVLSANLRLLISGFALFLSWYKWNQCPPLCLASFTHCRVCDIFPQCCVRLWIFYFHCCLAASVFYSLISFMDLYAASQFSPHPTWWLAIVSLVALPWFLLFSNLTFVHPARLTSPELGSNPVSSSSQ